MNDSETFTKLPAVLATQRTYTLSDAVFFNVFSDGQPRTPVEVVRHGVRGVKGNPPKKDSEGALKEDDVRNLHQVDSAKTDYRAETLAVEFSIAFTDLKNSLASIAGENDVSVRASFVNFVENAKKSTGLKEVANRYARNLLNARWLFRNRLVASEVDVEVFVNGESLAKSNALEIPLNHFNDYSEAELSLAGVIVKGLQGETCERLTVVATLKLLAGGGTEIFPSQNYRDGGGDSKLSRSLYVLNKERFVKTEEGPARVGDAAIRDQKVANAIRTIDTWYKSDAEKPRPIPVEQYGANLEEQRFFRRGNKENAFYFMKNLNALEPESDNGMFMIACLVRGAVYAGDS